MKKGYCFVLSVFSVLLFAHVEAQNLNVDTIMEKSEEALQAMRAGTRKMEIFLKDREQVARKWVARRAHKVFPDGKRELMVILEPEDIRGTAYMYWNLKDKPVVQWIYPTSLRRVRKLNVGNAYDSFFATDFTYADIDITDPSGKYKLLGKVESDNKTFYKVETIPKQQRYYSRIVSLIDSETFLPNKRDYYDAGGGHWKTKLFENITVINNIPMALRVRMLDLLRNHSTEVIFSEICHDVAFLKKEDFDPEKLPEATLSPVCTVRPLEKK